MGRLELKEYPLTPKMDSPTAEKDIAIGVSIRDLAFLGLTHVQVTTLAAGKLDSSADCDVLLVGSQTNLLAYDVEKNAEIYFKVCVENSKRFMRRSWRNFRAIFHQRIRII